MPTIVPHLMIRVSNSMHRFHSMFDQLAHTHFLQLAYLIVFQVLQFHSKCTLFLPLFSLLLSNALIPLILDFKFYQPDHIKESHMWSDINFLKDPDCFIQFLLLQLTQQ